MRKSLKTIAAASALIAGLTTPSVVYAHEGSSSTTGGGPGGATGMPFTMGQLGRMTDNRNTVMTSTMTNRGLAPNQQGKPETQPVAPEGNDQGK